MSSALAKKVQIKGRIRIQTPPITWYNPKNPIKETRKRNQYRPVPFLVFSMLANLLRKYIPILIPFKVGH
jgi:hypothetical protein